LDKNFYEWFCNKIGKNFMDEHEKNYPEDIIELMDNWEKIKIEMENLEDDQKIKIPSFLKDKILKISELDTSLFDKKFTSIKLKKESLSFIFHDVLKSMFTKIENYIDNINKREKLDYIFLVGGFGCSTILKNELKKKYEYIYKIILPDLPGII
jgi:hypothetical protein